MTDQVSIFIQAGSLLIALIGGVIALIQYIKKNRLNKADELHVIVNQMRSDHDIYDVIHAIEDYSFLFDDSFWGSELEFKTDKTLEYLSYYCYLREKHLIDEEEFSFLEYELHTVASCPGIQAYLYNLYHYSRKNVFLKQERDSDNNGSQNKQSARNPLVKTPFDFMLHFAEDNGFLPPAFYNLPGPFRYIYN